MTTGCARRQLSGPGLGVVLGGCFAGLMLVAGCNQAPAPPVVDTKAAEDAVRAADAAQLKAAQAMDVAGVAGYYTANAVVLPPNAPIATDTVSIQKVWSAMLVPGTELTWASTNVVSSASGDMVYDQGTYTANTKGPGGRPLIDQGKYLTVWMKQTDGSWKAVEDTWNSDLPIATAVAAPATRHR
jgi:ketosteroid isomerase-like protein